MLASKTGGALTLTLNEAEVSTLLQALMEASEKVKKNHLPDFFFRPMAEEIILKWSIDPDGSLGPVGTR